MGGSGGFTCSHRPNWVCGKTEWLVAAAQAWAPLARSQQLFPWEKPILAKKLLDCWTEAGDRARIEHHY